MVAAEARPQAMGRADRTRIRMHTHSRTRSCHARPTGGGAWRTLVSRVGLALSGSPNGDDDNEEESAGHIWSITSAHHQEQEREQEQAAF